MQKNTFAAGKLVVSGLAIILANVNLKLKPGSSGSVLFNFNNSLLYSRKKIVWTDPFEHLID